MEATANKSHHIRILVQVISPAPGRLECMRKALGYLSDMLIKVLAGVVSLISSLCSFSAVLLAVPLTNPFIRHTEVTERKTVSGFRKRAAHDRRHAPFTGSSRKYILN